MRGQRGIILTEIVDECAGGGTDNELRTGSSGVGIVHRRHAWDALLKRADVAGGAGRARDAALIGWRALGVVAFVDRGAFEGQEFGLGWAAVRSERQQLRIDSQIARDVEIAGRVRVHVMTERSYRPGAIAIRIFDIDGVDEGRAAAENVNAPAAGRRISVNRGALHGRSSTAGGRTGAAESICNVADEGAVENRGGAAGIVRQGPTVPRGLT